MSDVRLVVFVTGDTSRSRKALSNIRAICEQARPDFTMEIVNIQEEPSRAEEENIWATPALIKKDPPPVQRMIGNFSRTEDVLRGLNLEMEQEELS